MSLEIITVALVFAAIGVAGLFAPARVYATFGVPVETADGRNEIRSVYGGMCAALAVLLFAAPVLGSFANGVLLTTLVLFLGMAAGRLIAIAVERPGGWPIVFLVIELVGAVLVYRALDVSTLSWN